MARWGRAGALVWIGCLGFLTVAAEAPRAAAPPPVGLEAQLRQVVVPDILLANASPVEVAAVLEATCRKYADRGGYRLQWSVAKSALASEPRLMIDIRNASLTAVVTALARVCDLQVRFADGDLRIADQNTPIEPLLAHEFAVLPSFWTAVRENAAKDTPPGAEFATERVTAFLTAAGLSFPTGASLDVLPDHSRLRIVNTQSNLDLLRQLLRATYSEPFHWELRARLLQVGDEKVLNSLAPGEPDEKAEQLLARLAEKKQGRVLADFTFDALDRTEMREIKDFVADVSGAGQARCALAVQPQKLFYDYDGLTFELSLDCRITENNRPAYEHTLKTTLVLVRDCDLRVRLPAVGAEAGPPALLYLLLSLRLRFEDSGSIPDALAPPAKDSQTKAMDQKLHSLVIPKLAFEETPIAQAVNWLRQRSRELDPEGKGVNIGLVMPAQGASRTVTMSMNNIPLGEVIRYVGMGCGLPREVQDGVVWLSDRTISIEPVEVHLTFQDAGAWPEDFLHGSKRATAPNEAATGAGFDRDRVSAQLTRVMTDLGVDLPSNSWLRVFRFPLGHLLVTRASAHSFATIQMMLAGTDGELWYTSQVRTRVQVMEITDPALLQKVTVALNQPPGSSWPLATVPRLLPGKGVRLLAEGEVLALDGHPGDAQWTVSRGGEQAVVRVKCTPKVGPDGYTITSKLDWRVEKAVPGETNRDAYGWNSTLLSWDGEPVVLRVPSLAGNGAAPDDRTFVVLSAVMITSVGTQLRPDSGDTAPEKITATSAAPNETQPAKREARFYEVNGNVSQIADALGFVADTKEPVSLKCNAQTQNLLVSGCPEDMVQVDPVLSAFPTSQQQFRVVAGWPETATARMELLAVSDQDATLTLPSPAGADNRQPIHLTLRVKEMVHDDLYSVDYRARQATAAAGNAGATLAAGVARLHNGVPQRVPVGNGLFVTVTPVNPAGVQIPKPFAAAVELHQRLRQERQQRFAESAKLFEACLVPEFRLDKADLKTAVEKLADECRRLRFPPPAANLVFTPPAEVQIVEERTTTTKVEGGWTKAEGGWGNTVLETTTSFQETTTKEIVARRQKYEPHRTADLELHGTNLAAILRRFQTAYACRIAVGNDVIRISPVPDLALRRFSVAKAILKDAGADLPGFFARHGVAFQDTDRLLYLPELDTLLAFGTDIFLDAITTVLAAQDAALGTSPPPDRK